MADLLQQSSTAQPLCFLMVQSLDHVSPLIGASPTVTLSKAGGAFASPSGTVTEIANGWYKVAGNTMDTGTLGPLILHATAASGDPADREFNVVAYNPQDAVHLGLTAIPNAAAGAKGGLPVLDSTNGTQLQGFGSAEVYVGIDHIGTTATGNPSGIGAYIGNATAAIGVSAAGKITEVVTVDTVTNLTNLPSIPANWLTAAGIADSAAQMFAKLPKAYGNIWYVSTAGNDSNTGKQPTASGAFLTPAHAMSVASAGDCIVIGPGTFALGSSQLLCVANVDVFGAGKYLTILTSTLDGNATSKSCFAPAANSTYQGFTIHGIASATYQFLFGWATNDTAGSGIMARDLYLLGDSDGFYTSSQQGTAGSWDAYNCTASTKWDTINNTDAVALGTRPNYRYFNCQFYVNGPSSITAGVGLASGYRSFGNVSSEFFDCEFVINNTSGSATSTVGINIEDGGSLGVYVYGGSIQTSAAAGSVFDLVQNDVPLVVSGLAYNPSKTTGTITTVGSADVNSVNTVAGFAPATLANQTSQGTGTLATAAEAATILSAITTGDSGLTAQIDAVGTNVSTLVDGVTVAGYASGQDPWSQIKAQMLNQAAASGTYEESLVAARAQGFGKWVLNGTTLQIYAPDNATVIKTFSIYSASNPTSRQ